MREMYAVTAASATCGVSLWTCAFSCLPMSISCGTEMIVKAGRASRAGRASESHPPALPAPLAPLALDARGRRSRHFIRPMTTEASVRSGELNAVHEDNGGHVDPQQEDHDRGDRSLDERQA